MGFRSLSLIFIVDNELNIPILFPIPNIPIGSIIFPSLSPIYHPYLIMMFPLPQKIAFFTHRSSPVIARHRPSSPKQVATAVEACDSTSMCSFRNSWELAGSGWSRAGLSPGYGGFPENGGTQNRWCLFQKNPSKMDMIVVDIYLGISWHIHMIGTSIW